MSNTFTYKGIKVDTKGLPVNRNDLDLAVRVSPLSFREKDILKNLGSIELTDHKELIVAEFYHKDGNGFEMVVKSFTKSQRPGNITN